MKKPIQFLVLFVMVLSSVTCKRKGAEQTTSNNSTPTVDALKFKERYRPQFHFSPPEKWMNDPNGLVYNDGVYHLFYQYYPGDIVWGPMHWGHATSTDLIHWNHKPIALYPDELGYIFSGSAVVDKQNTSGFGKPGDKPLVAMFTYHDAKKAETGAKNYQTQGLAYSLDNGKSWEKYSKNPVIGNDGMVDFRDPHMFWDADHNTWVLILVAGDHAMFYQSENLRDWTLKSTFGKNNGAHGGVWECPDLFKLQVEGTQEEKWVLFISINPGGPNKGSATQYFVGAFDGETFTPDHQDIKWLEYGMDNYAGITYNNAPNNERIFIGWMSNWLYGQETPTQAWRSAMTLPRNLKLFSDDGNYYLKNYPIENFKDLTTSVETIKEIALEDVFDYQSDDLMTSDISFKANLKDDLTLVFSNDKDEHYDIFLNPTNKTMSIDRSQSGIVDFGKDFAAQNQVQPYQPKDEIVAFRIILDKASIELFIDNGRYVFTNIVFPTEDYKQFKVSSKAGNSLLNFSINHVNAIWNHE